MTTTPLDRRREQADAAHAAAQRAQTAVAEVENRLRTNADLTREQTQALDIAKAEVKRLKRALKTQARDRLRLQKAQRKAQAKAAKAQSRAATVEDKYGKTVLSDLVRREKERDRAAGDAQPAADGSAEESAPAEDAQPATDGSAEESAPAEDAAHDTGAG